ncbi:MAG: short-chain dehydrogenase, partial [Bacteroidetes bacterium]
MPTVLILGASSDMAVAIARKFAENKYDIQLAARRPQELTALQSDLQIRSNISCSLYAFDAMNFISHEEFYRSLETKPDVAICVFGYMTDNEVAITD